ncbi:MAG: sulfurtransferase TusA family protein [Thermodesulfobacteriota bacterium]
MSETPHKQLDLRGEVCPYTFVKSKLLMEEMAVGELLELIVDFPPAVKNVSRSMEMEGHQVLEVREVDHGAWKIILRKNRD